MDLFLKLNSQTAGKDKLARLVQYFSRALWHHFQKRQFNPYTVDKLKSLEYALSTFRKLICYEYFTVLRLGKSIEVLYSALQSIHYEDLTVKVTTTMSKISLAVFLLTDHILWVGRSGLANVNSSKWVEISNRYWLCSILMNLVRDLYEILRIVGAEPLKTKINSKRHSQCEQFLLLANIFSTDHKDVLWDVIKNGCDVWIPLSTLGYIALKPGTVGFLGTISSIAGLVSLINPSAKLVPS